MGVQRWMTVLRSVGGFVAVVFPGVLMVPPQLASAHHSFPYLHTANGEEAIEVIQGTVRVFKILNPHSALIVNATDAEHAALQMSLVITDPGHLVAPWEMGWRKLQTYDYEFAKTDCRLPALGSAQ